jgi:hypothetical protein
MSQVTATTANGRNLKLSSTFLEGIVPLRAPCVGQVPELSLNKPCSAQEAGIHLTLTPNEGGRKIKVLKPQRQWTGKLWNAVQSMLDQRKDGDMEDFYVNIQGPYGMLNRTAFTYRALMLVGAGVGFPSTGSMLRRCLDSNLEKDPESQQAVCFMWSASKVDQLLLCFPTLLFDLAAYVHKKGNGDTKKGLRDLKSWLTIKIFVGNFKAGDFLNVEPPCQGCPDMTKALDAVRQWLLGGDMSAPPVDPVDDTAGQMSFFMRFLTRNEPTVPKESGEDDVEEEDEGTYIAQGSLGGCFGDILRCSTFTRDKVIKEKRSLGICFCGPLELSNWIQVEVNKSVFPKTVEFVSEATA